jgi:hypothetical protein
VDRHGRRLENTTIGLEAREDNCRHLEVKGITKGNGHPREDEECAGYEEPVGRVEDCID